MNQNTIVFASANANKVLEIEAKLGGTWKLRGLKDIGCLEELPETTGTIHGNAAQKATYVWEKYGVDCFADDTGLEIPALNNEPGVDSADYAQAGRNAQANMQLVLDRMAGNDHRNARFRTVVCFYVKGQKYIFEGIAEGKIIEAPRGEAGFGYDPIFVPEGSERTFAEMNMEEKNVFSHRAKAIELLKDFLSKA